jgi:hypothetical protein
VTSRAAPPLLVLALFWATSPASGAAPPAAVIAAAEHAEPGRHAFVVGIDHFSDDTFAPLLWAEADAQAVADALDHDPTPWTVQLATGAEATSREGLLGQLDHFLASLGPDDTVLVYVSSHGIVDYVDGRPRRLLVTADTSAGDLSRSAVEVQDLLDRVDGALPRWKVVVLATCFGGTGDGLRTSSGVDAEGRRGQARLTPMDAWPRRASVVLSASYMDGPAWEDPQLGHEIYTYYLLEALGRPTDDDVDLNGDSALSAFEAHGFAATRTVERTGGRQFPSANLDAVGERDVILLGTPESAPRRSVFWSLLGRPRGEEPIQMWVDGDEVRPGTAGVVLEPGKHVLETGSSGRREHSRRLAFHVRKGQAVQVRDLVARAADQWLGAGLGLTFVPGYDGYNAELAAGSDAPHYSIPAATPAIRIGFEQRLWPRHRLGVTLAVTTAIWPAAGYDGAMSLPARHAAAALSALMERRAQRVSPAVGPTIAAVYLRSTGRDGAVAAVAAGATARLRIRLGGRFAVRVSGQLLATHTAPLALPAQFVLLPAISLELGMEL